jgi:hypothetical protein
MKTFSFSEKILFSLFISIFFGFLLFFILYIIPSEPGNFFTITIIWIFLGYTMLYLGLLCLLLRIFHWLNDSKHPLYVFIGVINICSAILCIVLYFFRKVDTWWLHQSLLNLFVGNLIIGDGLVID